MKLRDFMHFNRWTCKAMAPHLGVHPTYLSAVKNEKRKAGFELATKIEKFSEGQVTIKELRD